MTAVAWHMVRGLGAAALVAAAVFPPVALAQVGFLLLLPAALLLRGCPLCWLLGLAERLRALSTQRG